MASPWFHLLLHRFLLGQRHTALLFLKREKVTHHSSITLSHFTLLQLYPFSIFGNRKSIWFVKKRPQAKRNQHIIFSDLPF